MLIVLTSILGGRGMTRVSAGVYPGHNNYKVSFLPISWPASWSISVLLAGSPRCPVTTQFVHWLDHWDQQCKYLKTTKRGSLWWQARTCWPRQCCWLLWSCCPTTPPTTSSRRRRQPPPGLLRMSLLHRPL